MFVEILESQAEHFKDERDPEAFPDAIEFLKKVEPSAPLCWKNEIYNACLSHVKDIGATGEVSHTSSDGTTA